MDSFLVTATKCTLLNPCWFIFGELIQALVLVVLVSAVADSAGLWVGLNPRVEASNRGISPIVGAGNPNGSSIGSPVALLAVIYILEGLGRGVFEGPNRSVYADWFENQREMAFACWIVQSGGSASVAFFMLALDVTPATVRNYTPLSAPEWHGAG